MTKEYIVDTPPIRAWSLSRLEQAETCPYRIFLKVVMRIEEPSNEYLERGIKVHKTIEKFIKGESDSLEGVKCHNNYYKLLHKLYKQGKVLVEENWGFTKDWAPTDWFSDDVFHRSKLDYVLNIGDGRIEVGDHKTGRPHEVRNMSQAALYAIDAFVHYPDATEIIVKFLYVDSGKTKEIKYKHNQAEIYRKNFEARGNRLVNMTEFPPRPGWACKRCNFKNHCQYSEAE